MVVLAVVLGSWGGLGALLGGLAAVSMVLSGDGNFRIATWVDFKGILGCQEAAKTTPRCHPEAPRRSLRSAKTEPKTTKNR